ncbi:exported hypothetical protein [Candidatus Magnetomoraceae bacterium gMMP-1]
MKSKKFLFLMLILLYCTTAYANELQYLYSYIKNNKLIEAKEELLNDSRAFGDPQKAAKIIANHLMKNKQYDHAAEMYAYCIKFSSYYDELRKKISLKYLKASLEAPKFLDKWRETYQYEINDKMRELAKKSLKNKFETYKSDPINKKYPEKAYSRLAKLVGFKEKPYNEIKNAVAKIDKLKKDAQSKSQIGSVLKEIRVLKRNGINVSRDFEEKYTNLNEYYVEFNRGKSTNSFETGCEAYKSALTYLKLANGKDTESAKCYKKRSCLYVEGDKLVSNILPTDDDKSATINNKLQDINDFQKKINQFRSKCNLEYPSSDNIELLDVADDYYTSLSELKNKNNESKLIEFYETYQDNKTYSDWYKLAGFHIGIHYYDIACQYLTKSHEDYEEAKVLYKLKNAITYFKKFKTYIKLDTLTIDIITQYDLLRNILDNIKNGKIDAIDITKLENKVKYAWDIDQRIEKIIMKKQKEENEGLKEKPKKPVNEQREEEKDNESPTITINITFRSTSMNITNTNNVSPINITNTNNVSFECIGKDNKPDFLHYSYRLLKPYDKDWSENSPSTQIRKKDLKNGDYILQVKAIDNKGNESKPIECFFKVQVPFYHQMIRMENLQVLPSHSMWFVVIILLMVFSAIIYMFIFFIYKLKNYRFITFLKELFNRLLSSLTSICKKDKEKEKQYSINVVSSLKNFHIKNFNCIKEITRNNISKSPWILITGENGTGKTSLLQTLVIALHYTKSDKDIVGLLSDNKDFQINIEIQKNKENYRRHFCQRDGDWITIDQEKNKKISEPEPNILAYGSVRLNIGQKKNKKSPVSNLLNHNIELSNIMHWLKEKKDAKERDFTKLTNNVMECIASLIPNISEIKIEGDGIFCHENGHEVNINKLSAGQKSILAMVGDMIVRLFDAQPEIKDIKELEGIVFIDTLESHLHPTWQKEFPRLLSEHFPGVQFIATTNSPFAGVPKGSLFFKLSKNTEHNTDIKEWQNLKGALCREK